VVINHKSIWPVFRAPSTSPSWIPVLFYSSNIDSANGKILAWICEHCLLEWAGSSTLVIDIHLCLCLHHLVCVMHWHACF